jgi:hypothetical protein
VRSAYKRVLQRPSGPSLRQFATGIKETAIRRLLSLLRALSAPTIGSEQVAAMRRKVPLLQPFNSSQGERL